MANDVVFIQQDGSSEVCTPRNLVLLILPTAAPLMGKGACWVGTILKATTISLVFSTFRNRLLYLHYKMTHFAPVGLLITVDDTTYHISN